MPLTVPDVFLSYSRDDQAIARRFAESLEKEGCSVWWDQTLNPGEDYDQVTERALREARAVVVLWSRTSVESRWVRAEATQADRIGSLLPVMIEPCNRPIMFELKHTVDLTDWKGDRSDPQWQAFVASLGRFTGSSGRPSVVAAPEVDSRGAPASPFVRWIVAAVALIAVGAGLFWYLRAPEGGQPAMDTPVTATSSLAPSIAVLPFRDMSPNRDQEYFADGVTEEILNSLARIRDLTVTARTSAFAFKGKDIDLREVGRMLGVRHILEGSVRKDGDRLRITAQLIDAQSGGHLWSKTYERAPQDIFNVQDDIARSVAEALQITLGVGLGRARGMTRDIDAYDAFLIGTSSDVLDPASLGPAIVQLERATTLDPSFLQAWYALQNAYNFASSSRLLGAPPEDWARKADAAIEQIGRLSLDGAEYELLLSDRSDTLIEEAAHRQAALNAVLPEQKVRWAQEQAIFDLSVGKHGDALPVLEQGKLRDPLNWFLAYVLAEAHAAMGDIPAAIAEQVRVRAQGGEAAIPRHGALFTALASRDRKQIDERIAEHGDADLVALVKPLLDSPERAVPVLRQWIASNPAPTPTDIWDVALWMAWFGAPDAAVEVLRTHTETLRTTRRSPRWYFWHALLQDARKLPAFKELVREVGYVDYWRKYGWGDFCKPVSENDFECR